jgi:hypothetical protein
MAAPDFLGGRVPVRRGRLTPAFARQECRWRREAGSTSGTAIDTFTWRDWLGAALVDLMMRDLPPNVDAAVQRASDYVKCLGEQRTSELVAEWGAVHADLMAAGHELRALVK